MRIGLDIDGVTADFVAAAARAFGFDPAKVTTWDSMFLLTGLSGRDFFAKCREADVFALCDPVPGAVEGINLLVDAGHELHFVTHRPEWASKVTSDWLNLWFPILNFKLHLTEDKSSVGCDIYLDDAPHVLNALSHAGAYAVRYERPWNRTGCRYDATVKDWPAFVELVRELEEIREAEKPPIREFETGATRDAAADKYDYEGFVSPSVLNEFAGYMHKNRFMRDGSVRASDNWQKGIPLDEYMKSGLRHMMDLWRIHRGEKVIRPETGEMVTLDDALGGLFFNVQGYWHESLKSPLTSIQQGSTPEA